MYKEALYEFEKIASILSSEDLEVYANEVLAELEKEARVITSYRVYPYNSVFVDSYGGDNVDDASKRKYKYLAGGVTTGAGIGALTGLAAKSNAPVFALLGTIPGVFAGNIAGNIHQEIRDRKTFEKIISDRYPQKTSKEVKKEAKRTIDFTNKPTIVYR